MRYEIFDIEVFARDWTISFQDAETEKFTVIHNDNYEVKKFLSDHEIMLAGFNCKTYDNWILHAIMHGADPEKVKELNDWIIVQKRNGWEFPFLQYKRREFKSLDLRDDLPIGLSLKAIEGNMRHSIVESSVRFDKPDKLTPEELEEVIRYNKIDVKNTRSLFFKRGKYLEAKRTVAKIKGIDEAEALSLTNAKLTARFLDAKWTAYDDALVYDVPPEVKINKYKNVLEFFKDPVGYTVLDLEDQIAHETRKIKIKSLTRKLEKLKESNDRYECKLETEIAGVPHIYAWGGLHGAVNNLFYKDDPQYMIVTIDVGSYYPSLMLEYDYISRSIPSAEGYREVYHTRLNAKHSGDKATADALKLILNTCYGAMKNQYNDLYDPRMASAVCITGQLLLTDLIEKLEEIPSFELIQSNTDGIIIRFHYLVEPDVHKVVAEWESRTRMNMEYTDIKAIAQKDVNNYVMKAGATYMIKNGEKIVTDPDKGKLKTKGGYVSLAGGGDFKNNSLVIVHKALVNYFMDDVPIEETILSCDNIEEFQIIAKTGSTYDGTYWINDGERVDIQRVNRVYASKNERHGTIYKVKGETVSTVGVEEYIEDSEVRHDKIASLPEHCVIDNDNKLTIDDIDKTFYIELAQKRVSDYLGGKEIPPVKKEKEKTMATKNVYQKLIEARKKFLGTDIKKSGLNRFAEFKYFELEDIVPPATDIFESVGLVLIDRFENGEFIGNLVNCEAPDQMIEFKIPHRELSIVSQSGKNKMNELQGLGSEITYLRRYLYMLVLDIIEPDVVDATIGSDGEDKKENKKSNRPASPEKREEIKGELIDADGKMTAVQEKSIKGGLKKLKDKSADYLPFVNESVLRLKKGLSKKEAEDLLIEIGQKVAE